MKLSAIFAKPIDRHIEGVIKADDEADLRQEVEEYVLTNEVEKRLEDFLSAYNNYTGANGVWISGFFGSGKSHLLKMLALLLEDREIGQAGTLDLFLPKCGENQILRADLQRAVNIPSQSILFNIDQKADVISKRQMDALLAVFVKVFDEMCGYYGKQGHVAQFERDLDSRGQYDAFKAAYEQAAGKPWARGREQALLEGANIAAAYAQATGAAPAAAQGILDKYRADYKLSIEDFAETVHAYIERRGPNFRLNFFVDEVGQYIADNVKLMTNLQTVAESLATKSRGRAWIVVTAQEDMSTVMGEMGGQQSNDFSKIQARFANRMKLTSADVEEVISKRLLAKTDAGIELLSDLYVQEQNNFRTLFDFVDGSQTYRNYRDRDHFIHSYPFIPYQYVLFQSAIQSLSAHNAFEGQHSSVGERSMLAVFQQVARQIARHDVGQLATFDLMFDGVRTALKAQIQRSIQTAERHLENPFAVQLLKALFLVKYVKEFKSTPRNMTVLMLDHFGADLSALQSRVEEALNLLEQQTYVQRNGEVYEFLTDEEKDIEQEIKQTDVETSAVAEELGKLVYEQVIKERRIRWDNRDFPYTRKLDDSVSGRAYELAIHVISPFHEHVGNEAILRAQSMGRDELLVLMPASDRLVRDLMLFKQTEKYVRQNLTSSQQDSVRRILADKQVQNSDRLKNLREMVADLLARSLLVVNGTELEIGGTDPQNRIVRAFHELAARTYPNLRMLRGAVYQEEQVGGYLRPGSSLFEGEAALLSEAEQEMTAYIQSQQRGGLRTTMQALVSRFEQKPYGWPLAAIQCTLAKLLARGKLEARRDGVILAEEELERAIRNTHGHSSLILEPQIDFTASQVRRLRDFYADFFDGPPTANEAKALGQEIGAHFDQLHQELVALFGQQESYPFLSALTGPVSLLREMRGKPYSFYLTELSRHEGALLEAKENVLDPVRRFMAGQLVGIYDEARSFLREQGPNLAHVEGNRQEQLRAILDDPRCFVGNRMTEAKSLLDGLKESVAGLLRAEQSQARDKISERWERLAGMAEFGALTTEQQRGLQQPFDDLRENLGRQHLVAVVRDLLRRFDENEYPRILRRMTEWTQSAPQPDPAGGSTDEQTPRVIEPPVEYVTQRALSVAYDKAWLADEADVDEYLAALREALLAQVRDGKRVQV